MLYQTLLPQALDCFCAPERHEWRSYYNYRSFNIIAFFLHKDPFGLQAMAKKKKGIPWPELTLSEL